jgi:thiamine biosynthesis lipoprotein
MRFVPALLLVAFLVQGRAAVDLPAGPTVFNFRRENILGTSFDLTVQAPEESMAKQAETAALEEIERLRRILSTYDSESEISHLNATEKAMPCSRELIEVLTGYETWSQRSQGAYSAQLGGVIQLWRECEKLDRLPEPSALAKSLPKPGIAPWTIDRTANTVMRTGGPALDLNSLGKGYILGQALRAAIARAPGARGLLLNLGGDIRVWGMSPAGTASWKIGVADPRRPGENSAPLTEIRLTDRAVSTSAAYERGFRIGGKRYSHIIDPRTGWPARGVASATVVAPDNVAANALATMLCVLKPREGLAVVADLIGVECLIVGEDGEQFRSPGFRALEQTPAKPAPNGSKWPEGFGVSLSVALKTFPGARRPYVVVWVEDGRGKPVKTVTVWARNLSYLESLSEWFQIRELSSEEGSQSVTRATRQAGRYTVVWDGTDNQGRPVDRGDYTISLEVAREHGGHGVKSATIHCGSEAAATVIPGTGEFGDCPLKFGPLDEKP